MDRIVAVDSETTGLSIIHGGRIIEIGAVAIENGVMTDEFSTLIDTGVAMTYGAFMVHGISEDMLKGKPKPVEVWPEFLKFVGNSPLIAHNARFDREFIRRELYLIGHTINNRWECTLKLARKRLPELHSHKLATVYKFLFSEKEICANIHRALVDAKMAAEIWVELKG
ncbi:MAG: 3'-5' exonuclease [Desulfuromonadales bacterium]|nr:3'-5' exonuclease [Desulfuromonadales bacterium]